MPQRSVWRNTASVLGLEASALSALGVGSDTDAGGPGTRFSRLAYMVTVGGVQYTASGLLSEATSTMGGDGDGGDDSAHDARGRAGARRGIFIWLHGSESLRANALSRAITAGADGLVTSPDGTTTLLALLAQLGYVVIAPDDLGLGVSSARHQVGMTRRLVSPPPCIWHPSH